MYNLMYNNFDKYNDLPSIISNVQKAEENNETKEKRKRKIQKL